jgi:cytoskeleton-associated protein 5
MQHASSAAHAELSAAHLVSADTPLSARLIHGNWQVRLDAYEQLGDLFRQAGNGDGRLGVSVYGPVFSRILADPNPAACDRALDALLAYIPTRPAELAALAHAVGTTLCERCLPNHRPSIVHKALMALLALMQVHLH